MHLLLRPFIKRAGRDMNTMTDTPRLKQLLVFRNQPRYFHRLFICMDDRNMTFCRNLHASCGCTGASCLS